MYTVRPSLGAGSRGGRSRRNSDASSCTIASQPQQLASTVDDDDDEFSMSFRQDGFGAAHHESPLLSYLGDTSGPAAAALDDQRHLQTHHGSRPATSQSRLGAHRSASASPFQVGGGRAVSRGNVGSATATAARRTPLNAFMTSTLQQRSRPSSSTSMLNEVLSCSPIHTGALAASMEAASSLQQQRRSSSGSSLHRGTSSPKLRPSRLPATGNNSLAGMPALTASEGTKGGGMSTTTTSTASPTSRRSNAHRTQRGGGSYSPLSSDDDDGVEDGTASISVLETDTPERVAQASAVYQQRIAATLRQVQDRTSALLKQSSTSGGGGAAAHGSPRGVAGGSGAEHSVDHNGDRIRSLVSPGSGHLQSRRGRMTAAVPAGSSMWSESAPEAVLDGALHGILGAKFQPIDVQCPSIASGLGSGTDSGGAADAPSSSLQQAPLSTTAPLGQLQVSKALHFITAQIATKTSIARRERKNCFGAAIQTLRDNKVLHDRLKEQIAQREATEAAERLAAGGGTVSAEVSWVRENCKAAAEPWRFKQEAHEHRKTATERGTLARYMHHQMMEEFASRAEAELVAVRGAERSRDRQWMTLLSFLFSTRAVWACFDQGQQQQQQQALAHLHGDGYCCDGNGGDNTIVGISDGKKIATAQRRASFCTDPLAKNLEKKRQAAAAALRRVLNPNETDLLTPLVAALKNTCLCACLVFKVYRRKLDAARRVRTALVLAAKAMHTRRSIASLLRNVRTIQRAYRRHLHALCVRRHLTVMQYEVYCAERAFYNRTVCQETKDFEKRKAQNRAKEKAKERVQQQQQSAQQQAAMMRGDKKRTSVIATSASSVLPPGNTTNPAHHEPRRSSGAHGGGREPQPQSLSSSGVASRPATTTREQTSTARLSSVTASTSNATSFGRRLDDALSQSGGAPLDPQRTASQDHFSTFQEHLAVAMTVAKPWLPFVAHRNGRRYGNDPTTARIVALETHPLYPTSGAKLTHRMRDRLLRFVEEREAAAYAQKKQLWRDKWSDAKHHIAWLEELVVVQCKMKVSPAAQELKSFRWPPLPVRRCLLTSNEMRLLVLVGFTIASEEKQKRTRPSSGGASGTTATDRGGGGDDEDDNDEDDADDEVLDSPHRPTSATEGGGGDAAVGMPSQPSRGGGSFQRRSGASSLMLRRDECTRMADLLGQFQAQLRLPDVSASFVAPMVLPSTPAVGAPVALGGTTTSSAGI